VRLPTLGLEENRIAITPPTFADLPKPGQPGSSLAASNEPPMGDASIDVSGSSVVIYRPLPRSNQAHSSSGLGHRPLKAEIRGSNPLCATILKNVPPLPGNRPVRARCKVTTKKNTDRKRAVLLYSCTLFLPCLI